MSDTDSKLLVPIRVDALVIPKDSKDFVNLSPRMQYYRESILGDVLQPDIHSSMSLEKGVHLHWTLPKALKHTFVNQGNEDKDKKEQESLGMQFPYAPNRWMVIRLQNKEGLKDIPSRIWMVESDTTNKIGFKNNLPDPPPNWVVLDANKLGFKNIGKVKDWSDEYTSTSVDPMLQAVGATNPLFASFYPGCRNVFGFHDDMKDIDTPEGEFTYMVTGWYSNLEMDPIYPLEGDVDRQRTLEWIKQQWKVQADAYPTSSIFHATVHSLQWNKNQHNGVPKGDIQVYAGNTAVEALSAQITASSTIEDPNVETLLNALQYQLLEDERNQPSLSSIKTAVHNRSFIPKDRGLIWEVLRKETDTGQLQEDEEARLHFPDNPEFLATLKKLNAAQVQLNVFREDIQRLQQETYFLWYKQALKIVKPLDIPSFNFEALREQVLDLIVAKKVEIDLLTTEIEKHSSRLKKHDYLSGSEAEFELTQKLEDRFWEPNDPVLLLCGDGVGDTSGPNFQNSENKIKCRTLEQRIQQIQLEVPYLETHISIIISKKAFSVPKIDALSSTAVPLAIIQGLLYETLLLDQSRATDIALFAYQEANMERSRTDRTIQNFADKVVVKEQENPTILDPKTAAPESFAIALWKQAWTPLFMVWEAQYTPNDISIEDLDLLESNHWVLEDGISFKNKKIEAASNSIRFEGISPFTNAVFANLKRQVPKEIINKYGEINIIAQSMSGLNRHLLMQRPDIQLPPFKYKPDQFYKFDTDYEIDQKEIERIGSQGYIVGSNPGNAAGTDPNRFFPFRSGILEIIKLSIVDVFGQVKKVIDTKGTVDKTVTGSMTLGGLKSGSNTMIPLPPRIIQPSRLKFNWLNRNDEIMYQDTGRLDSPIFGWIVPNFLDNSIMVYDHDGQGVVSLQIIASLSRTNERIVTQPPSLKQLPFPGSDDLPDLSHNTHLQDWVEAIDSGSVVSGIMDLTQKVHESLTQARGVQNNSVALLFGQPIALARCSVGIELLGLPAYNQRWDQSGKQNSGGIESIQFPLFIGDFSIENDGVLGYFTNDNYKHLYTPLHAPEFRFRESEPYFKENKPLKLKLHEAPQKVTVLLDASAGVQLSSGILPSQFVELFRHTTNELLGSLNTSFMIAPFIADKVDPGIPIPTSINTDWKWTHKSDVHTWEANQEIAEGKNKQHSSFKKQQIYEGWLTLDHLKNNTKK